MKRSLFSEAQIIGVLKEADAGAKAADLARKHGVSEHTIYRWKAKYGGMTVSEAQRLKQLEPQRGNRTTYRLDPTLVHPDPIGVIGDPQAAHELEHGRTPEADPRQITWREQQFDHPHHDTDESHE